MAGQTDLEGQLLAIIERRYQRRLIILGVAALLLLLSTTYLVCRYLGEPEKIVPMSRQQAETPAGVKLAAELGHIPLRPVQAGEIADKVKYLGERPVLPPETVTVSGVDVKTEVAKLADKGKADFTIVATTDGKAPAALEGEQKVNLNVYNIRAYPRTLLGVGIGKAGTDIAWLRRVDVDKVPLLLPKGGIGYIGPFVRAENGRSGLDFGIRVMIPL